MQPYQNYYINQQPFMQQPMQNPYMARFSQLPNMNMPQNQIQGISGKYVQNESEVTASDVVMDGSMSFFPKADMSEIYGKAWQPDGKIKTVVFRPALEEQATNIQSNIENGENNAFLSFKNEITEMISGINSRFDDLEKSLKPKTTKTKAE